MLKEHTYVMSVAGFDPSGGAGFLADIKTFEQHGVYGLAVNTANTIQTERSFHSVHWTAFEEVLRTIGVLMSEYPVKAVKTGIVSSFDDLLEIVTLVRQKNSHAKIVVDPIIRSSTGFDFQDKLVKDKLVSVLKNIDLLTPNIAEAIMLTNNLDEEAAAIELSQHCNVLLKGGHSTDATGVDYLYTRDGMNVLQPSGKLMSAKHGSGCVLSAAITANLAKGLDLRTACTEAKKYVEQFLSSHPSLLGHHHV